MQPRPSTSATATGSGTGAADVKSDTTKPYEFLWSWENKEDNSQQAIVKTTMALK